MKYPKLAFFLFLLTAFSCSQDKSKNGKFLQKAKYGFFNCFYLEKNEHYLDLDQQTIDEFRENLPNEHIQTQLLKAIGGYSTIYFSVITNGMAYHEFKNTFLEAESFSVLQNQSITVNDLLYEVYLLKSEEKEWISISTLDTQFNNIFVIDVLNLKEKTGALLFSDLGTIIERLDCEL